MRGEKKRYCYIQKLITNKKYLIQEEKNMNIKEMNEEIIEKTAGNETDNRLKILELFGGAEFIYENQRYILSGQLTNGKYYRAVGSTQNFPAAKFRIRRHNRGLVFVS